MGESHIYKRRMCWLYQTTHDRFNKSKKFMTYLFIIQCRNLRILQEYAKHYRRNLKVSVSRNFTSKFISTRTIKKANNIQCFQLSGKNVFAFAGGCRKTPIRSS